MRRLLVIIVTSYELLLLLEDTILLVNDSLYSRQAISQCMKKTTEELQSEGKIRSFSMNRHILSRVPPSSRN